MRLRGGAIATVEWYRRAAALSDEPAGRLRRLLAAADAAQVSGEGQAAEAILGDIELEGPGPDDVARVELLRGRIEARSSSTRAASSRLLDAARSLEDADPQAAAGLYIESVDPAIRAGRPQDAFDAAERALELAPAGDPMGLLGRIARQRRSSSSATPRPPKRTSTPSPPTSRARPRLRATCSSAPTWA